MRASDAAPAAAPSPVASGLATAPRTWPTEPLDDAELAPALVGEPVAQQLDRREDARARAPAACGSTVGRRLALEVEQHHRHLHAAHAVGDGVVDLLDQRGPAVGQPLDDGELPQRAGPVEALHGDRRGEVEQRRAASRRPPPWSSARGTGCRSWGRRPTAAGRRATAATTARWRSRAMSRVPRSIFSCEPRRIGRAIEEGDGDDRGPQQRVGLDAPHEGVGVVHALLELHGLGHAAQTTASTASSIVGWAKR